MGWVQYQSSCYKFDTHSMFFEEADAACVVSNERGGGNAVD